MKDNSRIITIDGKEYAVDRIFDSSPAIFYATAIISAVHIDESHLPASEWSTSVPDGSLIIIATPVKTLDLSDLDVRIILYLNARAENHRPGATVQDVFGAYPQCDTVQHAQCILDRLVRLRLVRDVVTGRRVELSLVDKIEKTL